MGRLRDQIMLPERVNKPGHKQMSAVRNVSTYCKVKAHLNKDV